MPQRLLVIVTVLLVAACTPAPPSGVGRASVIDGDTLEVQGQRIRIWGVDAPEARQSCTGAQGVEYHCGREAAHRLDVRLDGRVVRCFEQDRDRYGRSVARCEVDGVDLGGWLVRQGWARRYADYAGLAYFTEEMSARRDGIGVWQGAFEDPWDWRRRDRE